MNLLQLAGLRREDVSTSDWPNSNWDFGMNTRLPRLKYTEIAEHCSDSFRTSQANCEAADPDDNGNPYGVWLGEGGECEVTLSNTSANDGDTNMPDCGDIIPGQGLFTSGSGTESDPYVIINYLQLKRMRSNLAAHYKLGGNIDARSSWNEGRSGCTAYTGNDELPESNPCTGWVPVGRGGFTGSLDGDGHTIMSLYMKISGDTYGGLFGATGSGAEIKNLGLVDIYVNTPSTSTTYGGLAGFNYGTIKSSYISGSFASSSSHGDSYSGGLVGINYGTIVNSHFAGRVTVSSTSASTTYGGGLMGINSGIIVNSYAAGRVTVSTSASTTYGGGLMGINYGTIVNSYAAGRVTVSSTSSTSDFNTYGGGLVGINYGMVENSYATGEGGGFPPPPPLMAVVW